MKTLGYYNGKFGELEDMSIPMNDRVCWFGDGVYDAGPSRNYKIFAMDEHVDRFFNSAGLLDIKMPMSKEELKALLQEMVDKMDTGNLFVYYQATRGTGIRNHAYTKGPANLWIMLKPAEISDGKEPIKLITCEDTRFLHCNIKTLNLIPSVVATQKAQDAGCQEAVYTLDDLFKAEEVIVSSSSNLCLYANEIDGRAVGGKNPELLENIRSEVLNEFYEATEAE